MSKAATEHYFSGAYTGISAYNYTKTNLGTLMRQVTGPTSKDKWAGPVSPIVNKLGNIAGVAQFCHVLPYNDRYNWIFTADITTAAITRRINYLIHDKTTDTCSYEGFLTLNYSFVLGAKIIRGLRATLDFHTGGSVWVNGTTVTGSGTSFLTNRLSCGSRIGFGSNYGSGISTWYEIASGSIRDNSGLTLTTSAGNFPSGTPYIAEDFRLAVVTTNATLTNGGLSLVKGLRPEMFTSAGTLIAESGLYSDGQRGIYSLWDTMTGSNITVGAGLGVDKQPGYTGEFVYILDLPVLGIE